MSNYRDPAYNPNREILGSKSLGDLTTGIDVFGSEVGKLMNGAFASLATLSNMPDVAHYFHNNALTYQKFQDEVDKASPTASRLGRYAAIADTALITTPIIPSKALSMLGGYGGAASSLIADEGSNREAPKKEDLQHGLSTTAAFLGLIGGATGLYAQHLGRQAADAIQNGILKSLVQKVANPHAQSVEAAIEGVPPEKYLPEEVPDIGSQQPKESFGQYILRTMSLPGAAMARKENQTMVPEASGIRG